MAVTKCVRHGLPITADGCPECSRMVDEMIASAQRHRTIPVGPAATCEGCRHSVPTGPGWKYLCATCSRGHNYKDRYERTL